MRTSYSVYSNSLLLIIALFVFAVNASYNLCWLGDSDCPSDCTPYGNGTENFDTFIWLGVGGTGNRTEFDANMMASESYMKQYDGIRSLDGSYMFHMTLNYFCCYTAEQRETIKSVLRNLVWQEFSIGFASAVCNVGTNESYASITVTADNTTQAYLLSFVRQIESAVQKAGVPINVPREQGFHSTLGQVTLDYPIDEVVQALNSKWPAMTTEPIKVEFLLGIDAEILFPSK